MRIDNLDQSTVARQNARIAAVERQAPLGNTSITTGRLRVVGLEAFLLQGTGRVTGTLFVDGQDGRKGRVDVTGDVRSFGGGRVIVSEAAGSDSSLQIIYVPADADSDAHAQIVGYDIPVQVQSGGSVMRVSDAAAQLSGPGPEYIKVGGNEVIVSGSSTAFARFDADVYVKGGDGTLDLDAGGAQMTGGSGSLGLDANGAQVKGGDGAVVLNGNGAQMAGAGDTLVTAGGNGVILSDGPGALLRVEKGQLFFPNLPTS
ncbi:hypothetical protein [Rathayibacter sp. VKM Ac-2630]|uniref:hypothetical protein n=1 Tax=Rathayibacter sp. VKM Ac-2630 TaxID=1938617 RepID=UPI0009814EE6|nr:hypothetical protein [Rathayibacter sp. VKM Ac-2630]OOB90752.1 hypothetical protein B0T42_10115 [Rathayibacter sp. VKM Ac-2630]